MKQITLTGDYLEIGRQFGRSCRASTKIFTKAVQVMRALSERPGADFFTPQYRNLPLVLPRFFANRKRYRAEAPSTGRYSTPTTRRASRCSRE